MGLEKRACLTKQEIEQRLVESGVQPTAQRIAICQFVLCDADHPSADEVKLWADENFPKMSLATVYNTLSTLVKAGLLREFRFAHMDKVVYDNNIEEHFHVLDETTGRLYDVPAKSVQLQFNLDSKMQNFTITGVDLVIRAQTKPVGGVS